jgi:hypothetical protein
MRIKRHYGDFECDVELHSETMHPIIIINYQGEKRELHTTFEKINNKNDNFNDILLKEQDILKLDVRRKKIKKLMGRL